MELRRYRDGDFGLTEALETDPRVIAELGGLVACSRLAELGSLHGNLYRSVSMGGAVSRPHPVARQPCDMLES